MSILDFFRRLGKLLPTFLIALGLALAVWISATSSQDPIEEGAYATKVPIEVIGEDSSLINTNEMPDSVSLVLSAPQSIWKILNSEADSARAIVDFSGLEVGDYSLPVQVQIVPRPVRIISQTPQTVTVHLEKLASKEMDINLVKTGSPAAGYQAESVSLSKNMVTLTGPETAIAEVAEVRAEIDLTNAVESINRTVTLQVLDANEAPVSGINVVPDRITVNQTIAQRFGYRNVVVKVVYAGQPSSGYRLTSISPFPPAVTVFSADPQVVSNLPGYIETEPVDLTNLKDDMDVTVNLNLPDGVSVVDDQTSVLVRVGVAAIESSLTLPNVPVEITGLTPGLKASVSPEYVTVILSGPVALLDRLKATDVQVQVDLTDLTVGTHQIEPKIEVLITDLQVESILPESVEVVITR